VQAAEERRAPGSDAKQAAEQDDGVDVEPPGARPVGVRLEIQPDGEFVQGQRRADAVADGHQPAEKNGKRRMVSSQVQQPAVTDQQQDENPPDQVVNVRSADHHPLEMALMIHDPVNEDADSHKREQKGDRGDEHALARAVGDGGADEIPQPGQLEEHQQRDDDQAGEGQQQQRSSSGHTLLNHPCLFSTREQPPGKPIRRARCGLEERMKPPLRTPAGPSLYFFGQGAGCGLQSANRLAGKGASCPGDGFLPNARRRVGL